MNNTSNARAAAMSQAVDQLTNRTAARKCSASGQWPSLDLGVTLQGWPGETFTCPVCDQLAVVTAAGTTRTHYLPKAVR